MLYHTFAASVRRSRDVVDDDGADVAGRSEMV